MERDQLKDTLRQLHQQLQSGEVLDPETQALLEQLSADVDNLAGRTAGNAGLAATEPVQAEKQTLLDRLLSLTDDFEDSHPQLAEAIGRVASALSRIGI
jgi:hypothetical protein